MSTSQYRWTIFSVTVIGNFIAILDSSSVNVALYQMAKGLNVNISSIQWVITSYMLVLTVLLPLFGKLSDIFPRNKLYTLGFLIFALGSSLNATATNLTHLIVYRCIEAIGASILISNSAAIISSIFTDSKRGKALGILGAVIALGGITGPAIGGMLIHFFGWQAIFIPNIPIALIGAYYAYKLIPCCEVKKEFKFDFKGFITFTISMFSILLIISKASIWSSNRILILTILAFISAILFFKTEKKAQCPMIDLNTFKDKSFLFGNIALLVSYLSLFTNGILFPLYSQAILKHSPFTTGLLILPFSIALIICAPLSGNLAGKIGSKNLTMFGSIIFGLGLLICSYFDEKTGILHVILAQTIIGIGNGMFQPSSNTAIMNTAQRDNLGSVSGILSLFRNLGIIIAVALSIAVFTISKQAYTNSGLFYKDAYIQAYHTVLYMGILFAIICAFISHFAYKEQGGKNNKENIRMIVSPEEAASNAIKR